MSTLVILAYLADIAMAIAMIVSICYIRKQYSSFHKDYISRNERLQIEKAIELAELYASDIIQNITYLQLVFKKLGINPIIDKIDSSKMKNFDNEELSELIGEKSISEIRQKTEHININILREARSVLKDCNVLHDFLEYNKLISIKNKDAIEIYEQQLNIEFEKILANSLNTLEYFSMCFNTNLADEETVYQSLQQTFLPAVKMFYFNIASLNEVDASKKYYTNIIELYLKWNDRSIKNANKCKELMDSQRSNYTKPKKLNIN